MPMPSPVAELDPAVDPQPLSTEPELPFRILVLGDFSGRANRGVFEARAAARQIVPIDRGSFDAVLEALRPELVLPPAGRSQALAIRFTALHDFHPDRLLARLDLFQALRGLRERLRDSATFAAAAGELLRDEPPSAGITLDDLLEADGGAAPERAPDDWSPVLRELVAPHLAPAADPDCFVLMAAVEAAVAEAMRALLHQPAFQELEAAWRALFFLAQRLETVPALELHLVDASKAELAAEMESARDDLRRSSLWRILVDESALAGQPWAVLAGCYSFGQDPSDLKLLARLGAIAREAAAPFLAAASPGLLENAADGAFRQIRKLPQAPWIGLAAPRFLLRLPYGRETAPLETSPFEEFDSAPAHEAYLWGNPAFACVCLLGEAFRRSGWDMRPGPEGEIGELPLHVYTADGEPAAKPCAESLMTSQSAEAMLAGGVMPMVSVSGRDCVRLPRFQSIADPPAPLAGRWWGRA